MAVHNAADVTHLNEADSRDNIVHVVLVTGKTDVVLQPRDFLVETEPPEFTSDTHLRVVFQSYKTAVHRSQMFDRL